MFKNLITSVYFHKDISCIKLNSFNKNTDEYRNTTVHVTEITTNIDVIKIYFMKSNNNFKTILFS